MKLPDFSENNGLNELRQQMGAELISWRSGGNWDPIDIVLGGEGKEIPPEEIEYAPDGTLGYEGRKSCRLYPRPICVQFTREG